MRIQIVGVHPVEEAAEPCYLVELEIDGRAAFDVGSITQPATGQPASNWQVPYDEHLIDMNQPIGKPIELGAHVQLSGPTRIAFFFHYLALDQPLMTSAGPTQLPAPSPRPARLNFMCYERP